MFARQDCQLIYNHTPPFLVGITGDIVGVFAHGRPVFNKGLSGIVVGKGTATLSVAFDQLDDTVDLTAFSGALLVVKLSNDVTYRRMKRLDLRTIRIFM